MNLRILILILVINFAPILKAQNWLQMNLNGDIKCFHVDTIDNVLYAGGFVSYFDGKITANGLGIWDGTNWDTLPNKLNGNVNSICRYKNKLYVTGYFYDQPFNCPSHSLMAWDFATSQWETVGIGLWRAGNDDGSAKMKVINNELYFYGTFDHVLNLQALNLVKFDGTNWTSLNYPSYPETINGIAMYKGELYAYGQFWDLMGDTTMDCVIKYNGTNWVSAGANFENAHSIEAMTVYKNELYVAGYFLKSDGCPGNNITKFDGTNWQDVNGGFTLYGMPPAIPRQLEVYNDTMYIGGNFDKMGAMPAHGLVKYDGVQFCAIDNTINQFGGSLAVYKNRMYLGGGMILNNNQDTLWFMSQQNKFGVDTCSIFAVGINELKNLNTIKIYPNPTTSIINIVDENNLLQNANVQIKNYLGQLVFTSPFTSQINLYSLSAGMYFLTVEDKYNKKTIKIIKQ